MTIKEFTEKWLFAFEDREQKKEFEKEMKKLDKAMRKIASGEFMGDELYLVCNTIIAVIALEFLVLSIYEIYVICI
jgi:hypothetical protein